jgi:hypothetical protein
LKLEPENASMQQSLVAAKQKSSSVAPGGAGGFPGMPAGMDLGSMMQQPGTINCNEKALWTWQWA